MSTTIKPRCSVCQDTGRRNGSEYIDCAAPGCDAAEMLLVLGTFAVENPKATPADFFLHGRAVERIAADSLPKIKEGAPVDLAAQVEALKAALIDCATHPRKAQRDNIVRKALAGAAPASQAAAPPLTDEQISAVYSQHTNGGGYAGAIGFARAVLALAGAAPVEAASQWISVDERLPEIDHTKPEYARGCAVLVASGNKVAEMTYRSNGYAKTEKGRAPRWEWRGAIAHWQPTHWMELPAAPAPEAQ